MGMHVKLWVSKRTRTGHVCILAGLTTRGANAMCGRMVEPNPDQGLLDEVTCEDCKASWAAWMLAERL